MPHKRAKRIVREKQRLASGLDLPPAGGKHAIEHEEIPKGAARILNAAKIQQEYRAKQKRKASEDAGDSKSSRKRRRKGEATKVVTTIQPGESMAHFNRRVEDSMRSAVHDAVKRSSTVVRQAQKEEESAKAEKKAKKDATSATQSKADGSRHGKPKSVESAPEARAEAAGRSQKQDFESLSTSAPRRLNDIVQAPPELKKLPRGAKARAENAAKQDREKATLKQGALSMAQKAMLEEERVRAVKLYREMKKAKSGG
ncbi:hypothetical protein WOLCODRAFT_166073 [Wolfiporia cocos MD-104 SS10]|uniref:Uncharacterized protein n=1 Tax=Wolfiporia cocos (strain MD-104) TaxID=742152 RepID=A0A2H3JGL1_WOLCO|nr:hypothetical protein WOLCODRAFT_166073 [Wolfiporia cocos MD-104 SS10]